ncbi:MAG TPA: type II secretion system protein GspJ [Myxococcaceae bacterium]|nr:type II secretion system protein GspJ [Myxococcaceae bacterium]
MRRRSRGFTLMEVMIAAAVVALMGMTVAVAFQTSARARDIVVQDNILYRQIRISLTRMSRELGSAFVSDKYDPNRYRDQNDRPTNFIGQRDRITFTTFAHQRLYTDSKQSDQAVVEYRVEPARETERRGQRDLIRRVNPLVQGDILRGGDEDVLFENIDALELSYWDSERQEWEDEWDTRRVERMNTLPTRVRVTLRAKDENGEDRRYSTQARIMLNTVLPRY